MPGTRDAVRADLGVRSEHAFGPARVGEPLFQGMLEIAASAVARVVDAGPLDPAAPGPSENRHA